MHEPENDDFIRGGLLEKKSIGNEDIQEAFMQWECCEDDEDGLRGLR